MNTLSDADIQSALRLNPTPVNYDISGVIVKSSLVAIQVSTSIVFLIVYYHMTYGNLHPDPVLLTTLLTSVCGYVIYQVYPTRDIFRKLKNLLFFNVPREHIQVAVVYLLFSYLLAPSLRTLTETISTDTIHVTACFMLCLHLITFDYGMKGFMVSQTISLNAAVIGSLFLASRLETDWHSIALLTYAVQSFILFPIFSTLIRDSAIALAAIIILSALTCVTVSSNAFLAYASLMFIVIIVCPCIFLFSCGLKKNMYGPWDEAEIFNVKTPEIKCKCE